MLQSFSRRAAIALVVAAVACGGGSDVTAPPGGGGGGGPTPVASVAVSAVSTHLLIGVTDSVTLGRTNTSATTMDASGVALSGRTVTWTSGAPTVASVNSAGVVTAIGAGTANIVATSEGKSGQVTVTVTRPAAATVTVSRSTDTLLVGVADSTNLGSVTLSVTSKDSAGNTLLGRTVVWTSGTTSVATVSSAGLVSGVSAGSSNVSATIEGHVGAVAVTVVQPPVAQVAVVPQSSSIKIGATEALAVTLTDAQSHVLTHRIISTFNNSPAVITVSAGQVTGVAAGTGTVSFSSEGVTTIATITVTP